MDNQHNILERLYSQELIINIPQNDLIIATENKIKQIKSYTNNINIIAICEKNSLEFTSALLASIITQSCVFILNPHWQEKELIQVTKIITPEIIFDSQNKLKSLNWLQYHELKPKFAGIMIPTGGTSGKIKFAIHTWESLTASAESFKRFWHIESINSFCCLPLYHVSGLMQIIRSFYSKGKIVITSYQDIKKTTQFNYIYHDFFISLVPTQLKFILENQSQWLKHFQTILVGGSATSETLKNSCRDQQINLALTYGMTETASGITILKPDDFLAGNNSNGQCLPHAQILIQKYLSTEKTGVVTIKSTSLFQGYYPQRETIKQFITDDIGYQDSQQYLHIIGRNSQKIITGGENVYPFEIEQVILATKLVKDIVIFGKKDNYWGEVITAIYTPITNEINSEQIKNKIKDKISAYKIPKLWFMCNKIIYNNQGKIDINWLENFVKNGDN